MYEHMDAWIVMQVNNADTVYEWRLQAEQRSSHASGKRGMSDDEVNFKLPDPRN